MDNEVKIMLHKLWISTNKQVFYNPAMLDAVFSNRLPDYQRERKLIVTGIKENIVAELLKTDMGEILSILYRFTDRMKLKYGIEYDDSVDVFCTLGEAVIGQGFETYVKSADADYHELYNGVQPEDNEPYSEEEYSSKIRRGREAIRVSEERIKERENEKRAVILASIIAAFLTISVIAALAAIHISDAKHTMQQVEENVEKYVPVDKGTKTNNDTVQDTLHYSENTSVPLSTLTVIREDGSVRHKKNVKLNTGEDIQFALTSDNPYREIVYQLNGEYDIFKAIVGLTQYGMNSSIDNTVDICVDGVKVFMSDPFRQGSLPVNIELNVENCNTLSIMFCQTKGDLAVANPTLIKKTELSNQAPRTVPVLPVWIEELPVLSSSDTMHSYSSIYPRLSNTGKLLAHTLYTKENAWTKYYVNGKYSRISGVLAITDTGANTKGVYNVKIYADDELVYTSSDFTQGIFPEEFDVNIKNCSVLGIEIVSNGQGESGHFLIGNVRLYSGNEASPSF